MKQYKYFFRSDLSKEAVGVVKAKNLQQAFLKASKKKQLLLEEFVELFFVEETE